MTFSGSSDVPSLTHHSYHLEREGEREDERERERVFERVGNSKQQSADNLVVALNNPLPLSYGLSPHYVSLKSK